MKYLTNKKYILALITLVVFIGLYYSISNPRKTITMRIASPLPNNLVHSPITVQGKAKGMWFFEGSFPIILLDANKKIITTSHATAKGDWMTEDFVPFQATFTFSVPPTDTGFVLLKKDNPSGDPKNDSFISIPVKFR